MIQNDKIPIDLSYTTTPIIDWCFCMPEQYKSESITEAYRTYFNAEKLTDKNGKYIAKWTNREIPDWVKA